ncbi:MAG TPA: hypothetical protein VGU71_19800 [Candidatus Dormibacteraeota bacterium]|nr:hypothetical protein [Candidatus Dormibacteraeota bacterium]
MRLLDRVFADEDLEDRRIAEDEQPVAGAVAAPAPLAWYWTIGLVVVVALPRLIYIFLVSNPENPGDGWYGDTYHHWQIAYLTKEIGLSAPDGPRLWDLKGLEYFWGLLQPLLLVVLFYATGSIDIVLERLLSVAFGVLVVVLIYHLCRRHWGMRVAVPATAFAALVPTSVFNDGQGILEPIGVGLTLLGIWLWPKRGLWTGVSWALAATARAEAWIFAIGMIVASFLRRDGVRQRVLLIIGWGALMLVYMKNLLDHTGNAIYSLSENFFNNALGRWEFETTLTPDQVAVRPVLGVLLALAVFGLVWTLWKRPNGYMFLTFGFGYWVFTAGTLGFTAYLKSWVWWFWYIRFFDFPYEFAGVVAAIVLFYLLPRWVGERRGLVVAVAAGALTLVAVQAAWMPILSVYRSTESTWRQTLSAGQLIGGVYHEPQNRGRVLNLPPTKPDLTYVLARFDGVDGKHIVGQLYDPFYYLPSGYAYADHPAVAGVLMQCWLSDTHTRVFVVDESASPNYVAFVADHQDWFTGAGRIPDYRWVLYQVDIPKPSAADCAAANRAARA